MRTRLNNVNQTYARAILAAFFALPSVALAVGPGGTVPKCVANDLTYTVSNPVVTGVCNTITDTVSVTFNVAIDGNSAGYDTSIGYTEAGKTTLIDVACLTTGNQTNGGCEDYLGTPLTATSTLQVSCDVDSNTLVDPFTNVEFYLNWEKNQGNNTGAEITSPKCRGPSASYSVPTPGATLTLNKVVTNDNSGTAVKGDWTLTATYSDGTILLNGSDGVTSPVPTGVYTLTETGPSGYTQTNLTCSDGVLSGNSLTLSTGDNATCTFTNDDDPPAPVTGTITLEKTVINDNGGTAVKSDFTPSINGTATSWDTAVTLAAGTHNVTESSLSGYTAGNWGGDCAADGSITLTAGQNATCSITNDDQPASLTLQKTVVNDNGGTAVASDFTPSINGTSTSWNTAVSLNAGNHTASETTLSGYTAGNWGGDCAADGSITLSLGQTAACTITNDDDAPAVTSADLSVSKTLVTTGTYTSGQTITYTIVVANAGPDAATNVVVNDLPTNLTITSVSSTNCSAFPCTIPTLANGASETITVQATTP